MSEYKCTTWMLQGLWIISCVTMTIFNSYGCSLQLVMSLSLLTSIESRTFNCWFNRYCYQCWLEPKQNESQKLFENDMHQVIYLKCSLLFYCHHNINRYFPCCREINYISEKAITFCRNWCDHGALKRLNTGFQLSFYQSLFESVWLD